MTTVIKAKKRTQKPEILRQSGIVPAVLYGPEIESSSLEVDYNNFEKIYNEAGESTLIDLFVEDSTEPTKVLIQDIQYDPVKRVIIHIDFRQIKMGEEMSVTIPLEFIGETLAVKELGGTLVTSVESLNAKCLPKDLVSSIEVNLETLKTFDDKITIADINMPAGITTADNPDITVASVTAPLTEEQLKAMEEENAKGVESVETEQKDEEEKPEEGKEEEKKGEEGKEEKKEDGGEKKE